MVMKQFPKLNILNHNFPRNETGEKTEMCRIILKIFLFLSFTISIIETEIETSKVVLDDPKLRT